jgi:hypothetical protein
MSTCVYSAHCHAVVHMRNTQETHVCTLWALTHVCTLWALTHVFLVCSLWVLYILLTGPSSGHTESPEKGGMPVRV